MRSTWLERNTRSAILALACSLLSPLVHAANESRLTPRLPSPSPLEPPPSRIEPPPSPSPVEEDSEIRGSGSPPSASVQPRENGQLYLGVERLFGVFGYLHISRTESDFGEFKKDHSGVQLHLFGVSPGRGDGQDGFNLSSMPRLSGDFHFANRWFLGGALGFFFTAGRRGLESEGQTQDPFLFPSRLGFLTAVRVGRTFPWGESWGAEMSLGPQFSYVRTSGDGAKEDTLSLQATANAGLYIQPSQAIRFTLMPFFDVGIWGRVIQSLRVAGVPPSDVSGSLNRHGFGLGVGGAWQF